MRAAVLVVLVTCITAARAADTSWLDIESRIQYSYFVEDVRSLRNLMEPLAAGESDRLKSYYAGLLAYRLSLLDAPGQPGESPPAANAGAGDKAAHGGNPARRVQGPPAANPAEARAMTQRCVASLDQALALQSDFADALALQSTCRTRLAALNSSRSTLSSSKSSAQLRQALLLAPKNPRVLLLDAIVDYEHPRVLGGTQGQTCEKLKKAVAAFEAERTDVDQVPGWGAADAYVWLAQCYLGRDEANAARDALERALLIAPDFSQARRLLARFTSG